jgi:N-acetylated-alpha-linked acidic dipeptidase
VKDPQTAVSVKQRLDAYNMVTGYGGEDDQGGVYHSAYDSFDHYVRFGGPDFAYGVAEAQTAGRLILRMANASVLPMQFTSVSDTLSGSLGKRRIATRC